MLVHAIILQSSLLCFSLFNILAIALKKLSVLNAIGNTCSMHVDSDSTPCALIQL